ncbi:MAG TPA: hypothetical protein VHF69_07945 [Candidatus Synoicihabitans sp.]|nr:hypothetical protein [Candidatus Synoicihabitans sp.]
MRSLRHFHVAARVAALGLGAAASATVASAATPGGRGGVRDELKRLVLEDVASAPGQLPPSPASIAAPEINATDVVQLDAVVVTERKPPSPDRSRETHVEEFFRTGTIREHVGRTVTSRLWVKGDRGVMLSFSW